MAGKLNYNELERKNKVTVHGPKCLLWRLGGNKGILYRYHQGGKKLEDILLFLPFHPWWGCWIIRRQKGNFCIWSRLGKSGSHDQHGNKRITYDGSERNMRGISEFSSRSITPWRNIKSTPNFLIGWFRGHPIAKVLWCIGYKRWGGTIFEVRLNCLQYKIECWSAL